MNLPRLFLLFSLLLPSAAHAKLVDKTSALVNGDVILYSDVESFTKNFALRKELDPFVNLTKFDSQKQEDILNYLIQEDLVLQKSTPTQDEVEEEINAVQRNNKIDREKLKEVLQAQGVKFDDYRQLMKVSLAKRKLVDRELRPLAAVTDDEVKNYYYTAPEFADRRKKQNLVLSYSLQQMLLPSKTLADLAEKKLRSGADFDAISAELADRGAEKHSLGTISEDKMNELIRKSINGLKVGESSAAINTGNGYMILKITDIGAPTDPVFEKEKEIIRNKLFQKALLSQLKLWTERERMQSYIHIP